MKKPVIPMYFLKADVVVFGESAQVVMLVFPGRCEEVGDTIRLPVIEVTHRRPPSGIWTRVPIQTTSRLFEVVEEHHASNVNVEEQEVHLPGVVIGIFMRK